LRNKLSKHAFVLNSGSRSTCRDSHIDFIVSPSSVVSYNAVNGGVLDLRNSLLYSTMLAPSVIDSLFGNPTRERGPLLYYVGSKRRAR